MFQVGQLVKWHETYGDVNITKDCGLGVVVSTQTFDYFKEEIIIYKIYRQKYEDYVLFENHNLELIKE